MHEGINATPVVTVSNQGLGTMSKNNSRRNLSGITLGISLILGDSRSYPLS